jgi:hypothetical protein
MLTDTPAFELTTAGKQQPASTEERKRQQLNDRSYGLI